MSDIPDDITTAATAAMTLYTPVRRGMQPGGGYWTGHEIRDAIAQAILAERMAERERCDRILAERIEAHRKAGHYWMTPALELALGLIREQDKP